MDFSLSDSELRVRDLACDFAKEHLAPFAREADEQRRFDRSRVTLMGKAGLLGGPIQKSHGGQAWSHTQWALALMELGAVDSSWRGFATVQTCLVGLLIERHGTSEQRAELLPRLCSGEWIFSYALTEPEVGTDVGSLQTQAKKENDGWRLHGEKIWITNGGVADRLLVFANVDPDKGHRGITCFLVDGNSEGLTREPVEGHELGHRGSDHARLILDGVHVAEADVVGGLGNGFKVGMSGLDDGRLGVASGGVGIQMGCVNASLDFARSRRQFGRRIGDFQLIQQVITDIHVDLEATRMLTLRAAWLKDQGERNTRQVSVAKYAACEAAVRSADQAVLLHGARGYSSAYPVERFLRDAKGLQIYEGTSHIQRIIIARDLLGRET